MECARCGTEVPVGSSACPTCGSALGSPPAHSASGDPIEDAVAEVRRAAKELSEAAAKLTRRVVDKAAHAAKDPSGSAKKAARTVAQELDKAAREIDRILRDL